MGFTGNIHPEAVALFKMEWSIEDSVIVAYKKQFLVKLECCLTDVVFTLSHYQHISPIAGKHGA